MLVRRLPPESALAAALRNDPDYQETGEGAAEADVETELWSREEHLTALLIEGVRDMRLHLAAALGDKKAAQDKREPIPRPGSKPRGRQVDPSALAVVLALMDD